MKKKGIIMILLSLFFLTTSFSLAASNIPWVKGYIRNFTIVHNHQILPLDKNPIVVENRLYLPAKFIAEAFDYHTTWHPSNETITFSPKTLEEKLPACNPLVGEYFIYGEIQDIDFQDRQIKIEQHLDHLSREVFDFLQIQENAMIFLKRNAHSMKVDLKDLKVGDVISLIVTKEDTVRGIIIDG
ncbi:stalk domain-containing protein [Clostridium formicaceticum]|uniref:Copper amine oxidase-like N-terminal domain-containing protein n=1 Tax=Clostridium formicaceticum TaxID=1497 RepID=A0AAC9WHP8_9CLOT|nr:stalk domain-containing protein [Clostridium formicaceticum]AOY74801.1 hypothetical protein BJL90_01805 [Clostridium formicaceticum]ARE89191.1 hypothetical protein CLFO_35980 [Clostridium formicaceticum]